MERPGKSGKSKLVIESLRKSDLCVKEVNLYHRIVIVLGTLS